MTNHATRNHMTPDAAARQALRAEVLSQILGVLAERARGALDADGADVDVLVTWVQADLADELT